MRARRSLHRIAAVLVLAALCPARALFAGPAETVSTAEKEPLALSARSAVLIDQDSGRVLYQRNPDQPMVPASIAKLMTLHIVYQRLADRTIARSDVVTLSSDTWADHQAPGFASTIPSCSTRFVYCPPASRRKARGVRSTSVAVRGKSF